MTNAFAFRATDPRVMKAAMAPVGPENDRHILEAARACALTVAAWGNDGGHLGRSQAVRRLFADAGLPLYALKINGATGEPGHPLYLSYRLAPVEWK